MPVANEENARVTSGDCESIEDGEWRLFGNGDLTHVKTGLCLGTSTGLMGMLSILPCAD